MQVFILQYFTRMVKNLKKRENTENLCLIIRGSQDHALQGPLKTRYRMILGFLVYSRFRICSAETHSITVKPNHFFPKSFIDAPMR